MKSERFAHLHVHSHYSLLDGTALLPDLVERTREMGMTALAVTDHGNMFAAVDFYQEARAGGIKPILGYEAYVAPAGRFDREIHGVKDASYHLTLLVQNEAGYKNLIKLASAAYLEGFYYRPRIDKELLAEHSEGLICLSGCLKSELSHLALAGDRDRLEKTAAWFRDVFGPERYFLEIQNAGLEEQRLCNRELAMLAPKLGLKLVATNDVHYLSPDDSEAHDIMLCINTGRFESDQDRLRFQSNEFYFKSPDEMRRAFAEFPAALSTAADIADRCEIEIDFKQRHYPTFQPPPGKTNERYLRELCEAGLKQHFPQVADEARSRLERELDVIINKGYADYFLIVWDFVHFAKQRRIPVGPGRGSAAGSLAAYCLGITDVDPLKYNLMFERFMDPERAERPDFDIDFCEEGRGDVIRYVREKYGEDCVAPIITFGTMAAKAAIRDVGRAMQIPLAEVDRIAKKIPATIGITLDDALAQEAELQEIYQSEPWARRLFDIARKLEGRCRHASKHAAGVIIADRPLVEYIPLYKSDDDVTTQYPLEVCDKLGMLKADFLGLRTLTIMDKATQLISQNRGLEINVSQLPIDDADAFALLGRGETVGVFQLESGGFRDILTRIKPNRIEDIIAILALYRPGPLGRVEEFTRCRTGQSDVKYDHPLLEPILSETCGIMLYQEQIMQILNTMGGIPLAEAYRVIKAVSKKQADVIEQSREKFIAGAVANRVPKSTAGKIFDLISYFASYGFNKSHSAAYAHVSYQTAYLKAHFPSEFMAARLTCEMNNSDKVVEYVEDCKRMGIQVLPPSINEGEVAFGVVGDSIRFGLAGIKNVGPRVIESLVEARSQGGPFKSIFDLCERVDPRLLTKSGLEALIKAGALDCLGARRSQLFAAVDAALQAGSEAQRDRQAGQRTLADLFQAAPAHKGAHSLPDLPEWPESQLLAFEKQAIGFYMSSHPLARYEETLSRFSSSSISSLPSLEDGARVTVGCMIADFKRRITRNGPTPGQPMAQLTLEDLTGTCDAVIYPENYTKYGEVVQKGNIVFVKGILDLRRETPSIRINELVPVEGASGRLAKQMVIDIAAPHASDQFFFALRDLLTSHHGGCAVSIKIHDASGKDRLIKVDKSLSIQPTEDLIADIRRLAPSIQVNLGQ